MAGTDNTPLKLIKATGRESLRRRFENSRETYVTLVTAASNVALSNITPFFQMFFFIAVNGYFISEQFLKLRYTDSQSIKVGCLTILSLLAPVTYIALFLSAISDPTKKSVVLEGLLGFFTPVVPVICRLFFNRTHTVKDLLKDAAETFHLKKNQEIIESFLTSIDSDSGQSEKFLLNLIEIAKVDYTQTGFVFDLIESYVKYQSAIKESESIIIFNASAEESGTEEISITENPTTTLFPTQNYRRGLNLPNIITTRDVNAPNIDYSSSYSQA